MSTIIAAVVIITGWSLVACYCFYKAATVKMNQWEREHIREKLIGITKQKLQGASRGRSQAESD